MAHLADLSRQVNETTKLDRGWPRTSRGLSGALRTIAPSLRQIGIDLEFSREARTRKRLITLLIYFVFFVDQSLCIKNKIKFA